MMLRRAILLVALCAAPVARSAAQSTATNARAAHDARMAWWRDARFGMFIHWGAYSVPAGSYRGERVGGGEWIMNVAHVPIPEYEKFVRAFNPVKYDADAWVRTAKAAGMKYIIITSKHHDGFALFDSKVSSYDLVDASPYHRDAIKALAAAAHRQGLKFGVYHSIMDWHHPDAQAPNFPEYNTPTSRNPHFGRYVDGYLKPQVRELLTQYPEIDVLWFDGEWIADWNDDRGRDLLNFVRTIKPSIIVNNRVANRREGLSGLAKGGDIGLGDFGTPEQQVPPEGIPGADWESCMTINDNWGYQSFDDNWKTPRFLVRTLVDVASKGGNLLLNVGPTSLGEIPHESVSRLQEMGQWLRVNGDAIYGTTASRHGLPAWGRYTTKPGVTYAHVFDWPKDGKLTLTGVKDLPQQAYLLADHKPLTIAHTDSGVVVTLPRSAPSSIASVIVLVTTAQGKRGD